MTHDLKYLAIAQTEENIPDYTIPYMLNCLTTPGLVRYVHVYSHFKFLGGAWYTRYRIPFMFAQHS